MGISFTFLRANFLASGVLVFLFSSCGGTAGNFSESSVEGTTGTTPVVVDGVVSTLTLEGGSLDIDLSGVATDESALVMLYSFSESSTSGAFEMAGTVSSSFLTQSDLSDSHLQDFEGDDNEGDLTEEFHLQLRELEESLDADFVLNPQAQTSMAFVVSSPAVGSSRSFKVLNSFTGSTTDTVTATLRISSDNFNFYVDARNSSALTDAELQVLADDFEEVIGTERDMFGAESDVDSDGKFAVLFTQTVNELGGHSGGMVTGFFYAVDLFDSAQYTQSNETEVYYTFVPDPTGVYGTTISKAFALTNIFPGVLTHEFQHMINFNQHYLLNSSSAESGWLNEGMSHLAEDLYSLDESGYMEQTGLENPSRVDGYLDNMANICFTCGTSLNQRGGSYLFVRYLYEQAEKGNLSGAQSGSDWVQNMVQTSLRGVDNVVNASLGAAATDNDFHQLVGLFGLATYFSNTGLIDDNRFEFDGIDLRSAQDDNRGTVLLGPSSQSPTTLPFNDTMSGTAISFIEIPGSLAAQTSGHVTLSVGNTLSFGAYLIR